MHYGTEKHKNNPGMRIKTRRVIHFWSASDVYAHIGVSPEHFLSEWCLARQKVGIQMSVVFKLHYGYGIVFARYVKAREMQYPTVFNIVQGVPFYITRTPIPHIVQDQRGSPSSKLACGGHTDQTNLSCLSPAPYGHAPWLWVGPMVEQGRTLCFQHVLVTPRPLGPDGQKKWHNKTKKGNSQVQSHADD